MPGYTDVTEPAGGAPRPAGRPPRFGGDAGPWGPCGRCSPSLSLLHAGSSPATCVTEVSQRSGRWTTTWSSTRGRSRSGAPGPRATTPSSRPPPWKTTTGHTQVRSPALDPVPPGRAGGHVPRWARWRSAGTGPVGRVEDCGTCTLKGRHRFTVCQR